MLEKNDVSAESAGYKYTNKDRYLPESLSELMKIVGKARIYNNGDEAVIEIFDFESSSLKNLHYTEWIKQRTELAKLGNALWDAKTEEDVQKAFDNIEL